MKKLLFLIAIFSSSAFVSQAQTWDEWFSQKKTQKKYLLEQIAALKVYVGYVKAGNKIIKDGTGLISNIKNGDLTLHSDHFAGLKAVNAAVAGNSKVKAIIRMHEDLFASQRTTIRKATDSRQFSGAEFQVLKKRYKDITTEADKDMEELLLVVTNDKLEMTDDQRIKAIDRLYGRMQEKYMAQRILNSNVLALGHARLQGSKDAAIFRSLHGLEP